MGPAQITPGETLNWRGVKVRVINVDGSTAMVRLESGDWRQCPLAELSPTDITAGSSVRSTELPIGGQSGQKVTGAEFVKRVLLEGFRRAHPAVGGIVDNYGTAVHREPMGPGTVLIKASDGRPVTVISAAPGRGLFVCKLENGVLEVLTSDELLTGDKQALAKATSTGHDGESLARRISGGGTLQKADQAHGSFSRGDRVRLRVAVHPWPSGKEGVLKLCGRTAWVEFPNSSGGVFEYDQLEVI